LLAGLVDTLLILQDKNLGSRTDVYGTAVTEVQITTCTPRPWTPPPAPSRRPHTAESSESHRDEDYYHDMPDTSLEAASHPRFETTCTSSGRGETAGDVCFPRVTAERPESTLAKVIARLRHLDPVKLAYLRTSFVFAISILVTWTPSSINRVHNLIHPNDVSYGLNVASAIVLPLQGVWNAVIYFSTSWGLCKEEMQRTWLGGKVKAWLTLRAERAERAAGKERGVLGRGEINGMALELSSVRLGNVRAMRGSF
jgi:hypothetical protein